MIDKNLSLKYFPKMLLSERNHLQCKAFLAAVDMKGLKSSVSDVLIVIIYLSYVLLLCPCIALYYTSIILENLQMILYKLIRLI